MANNERTSPAADYQQLFIQIHTYFCSSIRAAMIISYLGSVGNNLYENKHVEQVYAQKYSTVKWTHTKSCRTYKSSPRVHPSCEWFPMLETYITMKLLHLIPLLYGAILLCAIVISALNPKSPRRI